MKHTYTILTLGCGSLRHLEPGDQSARNTTNGTRSKLTERTSKAASNGIIFFCI